MKIINNIKRISGERVFTLDWKIYFFSFLAVLLYPKQLEIMVDSG